MVWTIILAIIGGLGGVAGLFTALAYYTRIGRKYDVENDSTEIKSLREVITVLKDAKESLEKRVEALEIALGIKNAKIVELESDNINYQRAHNHVVECDHAEKFGCVVAQKYNELSKKHI